MSSMSSVDPISHVRRSVSTILLAGCTAGALDFVAATASTVAAGGSPFRPWMGVAAALVGKAAVIAAGAPMVLLGAVLHFFITISGAAIYFLIARRIDVLKQRPVASGFIFGILFMLVMNYAILPLSWIGKPLYVGGAGLVQAAENHILMIGWPISLIVARRSYTENVNESNAPI